MGEKFLVELGAYVLKKALSDPKYQELIKDAGREVGKAIPGTAIEPEIANGMDLLKEGLLEEIS